MKDLISIRKIWQDAGYVSRIADSDIWQARFQEDWKCVFTYVDYDFDNKKWTSPNSPTTFGVKEAENFSYNAMSRAAEALGCIIRKDGEVKL